MDEKASNLNHDSVGNYATAEDALRSAAKANSIAPCSVAKTSAMIVTAEDQQQLSVDEDEYWEEPVYADLADIQERKRKSQGVNNASELQLSATVLNNGENTRNLRQLRPLSYQVRVPTVVAAQSAVVGSVRGKDSSDTASVVDIPAVPPKRFDESALTLTKNTINTLTQLQIPENQGLQVKQEMSPVSPGIAAPAVGD